MRDLQEKVGVTTNYASPHDQEEALTMADKIVANESAAIYADWNTRGDLSKTSQSVCGQIFIWFY